MPSSDQQSTVNPDSKLSHPNQSESLCRQTMNDVPADFLPLSHAVDRLANGMWGGLQRPEPVAVIKQDQKKLSLGFGPWREEAGRRLRAAAVEGKLVIYVLATRPVRSEDHSVERSLENNEPVVVPVSVLNQLIASRGSLPDHPIRPSIQTAEGNQKLFVLLTVGLLVVRAGDFDVWYQSERAKGKWPSQKSKEKKDGRPTKQTDALRNTVLALVHDHKWSGKDPISALHRLLVASGRSDVPSQDTLARLVDHLYRETGEAALLRIPRARRK